MTLRIVPPPGAGPLAPESSAEREERDRVLSGMTRYPPLFVPSLSADEQQLFADYSPTAFWIGGNLDGPQPVKFGDNAGRWPVRWGLTQAWRPDRKKKHLVDGVFPRALLLRYWCDVLDGDAEKSWEAADKIWQATYRALEPHSAPGFDDYLSFDPGLRLGHIDVAVREAARALRIDVMTCREVKQHLRLVVQAARTGALG